MNYYVVTNCRSEVRFYNAYSDDEIAVDGKVLTKFVSLDVLQKLQAQVSEENSLVVDKAYAAPRPFSEAEFRQTLKSLADIYRSAGLRKGDERIDPTVSFVVLKYIADQENARRTLNRAIELWDDLRAVAKDEDPKDLGAEFRKMVDLMWGEDSEYRDNIYQDFRDLIVFSPKLRNEHFRRVYNAPNGYNFHGADFDLFGAIYEEFASQTKKKEFGEFYTRRHITGVVARLLLRRETNPRDLKICDPACGTGGFLTESYKALRTNYSLSGKLDEATQAVLREDVFWGYDNDEKSVARTKLNMFLVGDGHMHIHDNDSLAGWNTKVGWQKSHFDYVVSNPPMGTYDGAAKVEDFHFTNERRYELLFAERIVEATRPGGEIALVINDGALEAPAREDFRKKLLAECDIHAIVSLTKFAFAPYTKEKTYVLFMQKKLKQERGQIQVVPIWHYIVDYDGFANSDKRFRTKYHDDLPELEDIFDQAVNLVRTFLTDSCEFDQRRGDFEREVNPREEDEGLFGRKFGYVEMESINEASFHNLLSEFHLRPMEVERIGVEQYSTRLQQAQEELRRLAQN